ncbi:HpcH/HpaI aldolase/citrate lyase family protein [Cryptosporangium sp. NPDC048952]|uniref:HpcH/HpaI aldolase family protein n=1 Tax=Cryptosporangium sp. NPDC048952 TaxID=3363961 RepID=UPI0037108AA3
MRESSVRALLAGGGTAVNAWLSGDSPFFAETLSHAGFDVVTVDLQHGMFGLDGALRLLQAISAGPAEPFARCPSHDPAIIGKLLDAGAYGIICPGVDSVEDAAAFVAACRYPPVGRRSFGPARALLYGGADYVDGADETVLTWAMIESAPALEAVEEIVATPGLDGVFVGPNDLALALGERPGQVPAPAKVEEAWVRIVEAAHAAGIYAGSFCANGTVAAHLTTLGYDLVTPGSDAAHLRAGASAAIAAARSSAAPASAGAGGAEGAGRSAEPESGY